MSENNEFTLHSDLQRDCVLVASLPLCELLLCNDSQYRWFIMVPRRNDVSDLHQLDWQDLQQFINESSMVSELLMQEFQGDKMNVAALGNVTPQLHIHHIVRFKDDPVWPKPIWGQLPLKPYPQGEIDRIQTSLSAKLAEIMAQ
ncbi:HIT domain-containing protein [Thalassotalea mangrovi]|uniref:HIT domain-containing protein n=1 Tax=Thalassotalea mangrovi TaxID=2572245 RepID=A0A4U1B9I0_9GAMM|nr:HIT domain-containing protein [Thalassotalea mangrovi]TKB47420.1 HIT domain-containing protein [Thalassotalea mangrovi]